MVTRCISATLLHRLAAVPVTDWILWLGSLALTVSLVVLLRTRWGQSRPLQKCAVLSLLVHALLACLAMTVRVVVGEGGGGTAGRADSSARCPGLGSSTMRSLVVSKGNAIESAPQLYEPPQPESEVASTATNDEVSGEQVVEAPQLMEPPPDASEQVSARRHRPLWKRTTECRRSTRTISSTKDEVDIAVTKDDTSIHNHSDSNGCRNARRRCYSPSRSKHVHVKRRPAKFPHSTEPSTPTASCCCRFDDVRTIFIAGMPRADSVWSNCRAAVRKPRQPCSQHWLGSRRSNRQMDAGTQTATAPVRSRRCLAITAAGQGGTPTRASRHLPCWRFSAPAIRINRATTKTPYAEVLNSCCARKPATAACSANRRCMRKCTVIRWPHSRWLKRRR